MYFPSACGCILTELPTERGQQLTHQLINSGSEERRECCLEEHQQVSIEWKSDGDLFWQCKVLSCESFCYIFTHVCMHKHS